jgi:RNA polymerase sigma-70 factor, ECF subfamily
MTDKITIEKIETKYSLPDLFEIYSLDIFRYAKSLLKDSDEAKDAVQEVFVKYTQNESSFKSECSQKTWLLVITRNYCFNKIKSGNWNNARIDEEIESKPYEIDLDMQITLEGALRLLSPEHNELLYLKEFENYSYKEIADITGLNIENVKIKLFRARQNLRKILMNDCG